MKLQKIVLCSIVAVCFIYLIAFQIYAIWAFNIDDTFITLRYAKNWADGFGLVWNVGAPPVEGYSNFIFVFLAYIALHLGLKPLLVLKIAGACGLILSAIVVYGISRNWAPPRLACIPSAWLLMYEGEIVWGMSGLETSVYQTLIAASVYFMFKGLGFCAFPQTRDRYQTRSLVISALCLSIAGLTRPEAPALMVLFFMILLMTEIVSRKNRAGFITYFMTFSLVLFCAFAPYFVWRLMYYGRLFPNSVYCKGIAPILNFDLTKEYWMLIWPFMLLALPAVWKSKDNRHWFLWLPGLLYSIMLLHSDPIVAFYNRLFLPAFAVLLPLAFFGLLTAVSWYLKERDGIYDTVIYFIAFIVGFLCIPSFTLGQYQQFSEFPQKGEQLRLAVANWLNQHVPANQSIVLGDCGLVPFKTPHAYIDSYCLNNAAMTRNPSPSMYQEFCQQILKQTPSTFVLTALIENGKVIYAPADACLAELLPKNNQYQKAITLKTGNESSSYKYEIYTLKK